MKIPHLYTGQTIGMFHCLEKIITKKTKELIENGLLNGEEYSEKKKYKWLRNVLNVQILNSRT